MFDAGHGRARADAERFAAAGYRHLSSGVSDLLVTSADNGQGRGVEPPEQTLGVVLAAVGGGPLPTGRCRAAN